MKDDIVETTRKDMLVKWDDIKDKDISLVRKIQKVVDLPTKDVKNITGLGN